MATDQRLAGAESPAALTAAAAAEIPRPVDSTNYPAVPVIARNDPTAYVFAFAAELLDRAYTDQTRSELLGWVQAEEAPNTLPGVPATLGDKSLVFSLTEPDPPGPSPIPSPAGWVTLARGHVTQTVSDLQVEVDPTWTALVTTGWQPVDPAMTIMAVTGTLSIDQSDRITTESFSMAVTLGSAALRPGFGSVAVDDWTVN